MDDLYLHVYAQDTQKTVVIVCHLPVSSLNHVFVIKPISEQQPSKHFNFYDALTLPNPSKMWIHLYDYVIIYTERGSNDVPFMHPWDTYIHHDQVELALTDQACPGENKIPHKLVPREVYEIHLIYQ
jgi:hypothetical protein